MIRVINKELQGICSLNHDSILRDDFEAVKQFSWETVWIELTNNMPTLMAILTGLVPNACDNKPFLCFVASMLLKKATKNGLGSACCFTVTIWKWNKQTGKYM